MFVGNKNANIFAAAFKKEVSSFKILQINRLNIFQKRFNIFY